MSRLPAPGEQRVGEADGRRRVLAAGRAELLAGLLGDRLDLTVGEIRRALRALGH